MSDCNDLTQAMFATSDSPRLEARLVVEVDGGHHNQEEQTAYDSKRTAWLRNENFQVLRFLGS